MFNKPDSINKLFYFILFFLSLIAFKYFKQNIRKDLFYFYFIFYLYIYPPDSQESDGGANT